jgi:hypothetical protein
MEKTLTVIEGNKLIAEFMGYKYFRYPARDPGWRKEKGHLKMNGYFLCRTHNQLRYHRDWSWLMPVLHKWDTLPHMGEQYEELCDQLDRRITYYEIDEVYPHIVRCITWYNTQTPTT